MRAADDLSNRQDQARSERHEERVRERQRGSERELVKVRVEFTFDKGERGSNRRECMMASLASNKRDKRQEVRR